MLNKSLFSIFITAIMLFASACGLGNKDVFRDLNNEAEKITVVATLFPQYDFARQIAGDKADVILLLLPGVEAHSYEPTPADIIKINKSDLFIYTGPEMEAWAQRIIDGMENSKAYVLNASQNIALSKGEFCQDCNNSFHVHKDDELCNHIHEEEAAHDESLHKYDPHIWTNPQIAKLMVENIAQALCLVDPPNKAYYQANKKAYQSKLDDLDRRFRSAVEEGKRNKLVFGGRFALYYFSEHYGLDILAAYDSCSSHTEPSVKRLTEIINTVNNEGIPVIYYEELSQPKVATSISEATGAKMLLFHSCHNLSKAEKESGATYLSLMEQNLENLKQGLE